MVKRSRSLCVIFSLFVSAMTASAGAMRTFPNFQPASLPKGDDLSTSPIPLGFTINFLGQSTDSVYVDTNGAVTFNSPFVGYPGVPPENYAGGVILPLSSSPQAMICAFLSDINTSRSATGVISYGTTNLNGRPAFVVTYSNVSYFSFAAEDFDRKHNSFQIVLVERSDTGPANFDIELNYDQIQWESADSNGGKSGFGGYTAMVGYTNGTRATGTVYELPGSRTPGSYADGAGLSLTAGSQNSGTPGRYIFEIRNTSPAGVSGTSGVSSTPEAATPVISGLVPATVISGGGAFTLTVNGSGFAPNSTVTWNTSGMPTVFVSPTQLTATIPAMLIASVGMAGVNVNTTGVASNTWPIALKAYGSPTPPPTSDPTPPPTPAPTSPSVSEPTPPPVSAPTPPEVSAPTPPEVSAPTPPPTGFVSTDTTTQGNWQSAYGSGGYYIANSISKAPAYAVLTLIGSRVQTWADNTTDPRALQVNGGIASCYCSSNYLGNGFTIDVDMSAAGGQTHQVALYLLDWDTNDRNETVRMFDVATGAILDTRSVSSFNAGQYLVYNVSGHIRFVVTTNSSRLNAVVSGVFFGQ